MSRSHDFDFEFGTWNIAARRLVHPLTGSHTWSASTGRTHIVEPVWGGAASIAQLEDDRATPWFLGLMLRLYHPKSHEWSITWAASSDGTMDPPLIGRFANGRGTFFAQEPFDGKTIFVRVVYADITRRSFRTELAFSADGGRTWETNLIQTFTRRT